MMDKMKIITCTLVLLFSIGCQLNAQYDNLIIKMTDGSSEELSLSELKQIKFDNLNSVPSNQTTLTYLRNSPNPFQGETTIEFNLINSEKVNISIYDFMGELVKQFEINDCKIGKNSIVWDGTNESGSELKNGVYFIKILSGPNSLTRKVIMIK